MARSDSDETKIALINNNIQYIQKDIAMMNTTLKELAGVYLTKQEFIEFKTGEYANVRRLVFGAVGLILIAFAGEITRFFIGAR